MPHDPFPIPIYLMSFTKKSQATTPLLDAVRESAGQCHAPFYTPGHKRGAGISQSLADCFGSAVFRADLTELPGLDNLFVPEGAIAEAQQLAAIAFGAEQTWFLANGSTSGILAAILATCGPGDQIILPRNVHQSVIAGLILSGAVPIFVSPEYDPVLDLAHSITPRGVQAALAKYPNAKAVMIVYPTYYGVCGNVSAIAHIAHQHGIPLLVDEAHGSHFTFHPELPLAALSAGADLTVQSTHKVLGSLTQSAMLHVQGNRIERDRISKALQLVQSSSPSYLLLASLDAARQQMALQGKQLMAETLHLADTARAEISQIPGLSVLTTGSTPGFVALDRTRLTVTVSELGLTGFAADEILTSRGVISELASCQHLTFIVSFGNNQADIQDLVQAFTTLSQDASGYTPITSWQDVLKKWQAEFLHVHPSSFIVHPYLSPREAFFAPTETLPVEETFDRISAELICPYPPGIPILMPGEAIAPAAIDYLQQVLALGGTINGCSDPHLQSLKVVRD